MILHFIVSVSYGRVQEWWCCVAEGSVLKGYGRDRPVVPTEREEETQINVRHCGDSTYSNFRPIPTTVTNNL